MKIEQISETEWTPISHPVWLFSFPLKASEFEERSGIHFSTYWDDGLGIASSAFGKILDAQIHLKSHPDGPEEAQYVSLYIHAQETRWDDIRRLSCQAVNVSIKNIPARQEELMPGKWILARLDDNGNHIEMFRFPDEYHAETARRIYEARGHKQLYDIYAAT